MPTQRLFMYGAARLVTKITFTLAVLTAATVGTAAPFPTVATLAATGQSNTLATLNGTVNPNGSASTAWFEWGTAANNYTQQTTPVAVGSGSSAVTVSSALTGLTPGVIYHGRIVVTNAVGLIHGGDVAFGSPTVVLNGAVTMTNLLGSAFTDPGVTASGSPLAIDGGEQHSLALRSDGTVIGWGNNGYGQTTIPAGLSNAVAIAAEVITV
jgi:hypothetical protein